MNSEFVSILFGLASAASWGAGDFSGGLASKRASAYSVVIASQAFSILLVIGLALLLREAVPSWDRLAWAAIAGLCGAVGLVLFYQALATGRMGTAAPVAAVLTAGLPVIVGAFLEGLPNTLKLLGFGLALIGIWLISQSDGTSVQLRELGLPAAAGIGFGLFVILMDRADRPDDNTLFWLLTAARLTSVSLFFVIARLTRQPIRPPAALFRLIALVGVLDLGGNAFYMLAAQTGRLDVAAVLSALYPASTILLAWFVLKERLTRLQFVGIALALGAIALIVV